MKLISEIITKRLELCNEAEIMHDYHRFVWHFYSVYNICLVLTGVEDKNISKKNLLVSNLINNFTFRAYSKLKDYMKQDYVVINNALEILQEIQEESDFYGDYDLPDMIAISVYD